MAPPAGQVNLEVEIIGFPGITMESEVILGFKTWFKRRIDNQHVRDDFVRAQLAALPKSSLLLDAGCGSQRYRGDCQHLQYRSQDFGQYVRDEKGALATEPGGCGGAAGYAYGKLDYVGDIWKINEKDKTFDAILCTEVYEHIPFPVETTKEFARLLKPGGKLILTAPSNCLRHMDPYFFYSGFSDRWFEKFVGDAGFEIQTIDPVGDYYSWLFVEMYRTMRANSVISKIVLMPALIYYLLKKKTKDSVNTMCMGYHVVAIRKS